MQHTEHFRGTLSTKTTGVEKFRQNRSMDDEDLIRTTIPHSEFGNPECCGCLTATVIADTAVIACNECGAVVKMVPAGEIHNAIAQLETQLETATSTCPHCGAVSRFPGFSEMLAFICRSCGRGVDLTK